MSTVWVATSETSCEGGYVIGVAADDATAKAICRDYIDDPLDAWEQHGDGRWEAAVTGSIVRSYSVTPHEVQEASATS